MWAFWVTALIGITAASIVLHEVRTKNLNIWAGTYLRAKLRKYCRFKVSSMSPVHILFCVVDHFEPVAEGSTPEQERERMCDWLTRYPVLARQHKDSDGRPPQHTWFYPG